MSANEIKDFLAIPNGPSGELIIPDKIVNVNIPPNVKLRTGKALSSSGGDGGAIQFDIPIEQSIDATWFTNSKDL